MTGFKQPDLWWWNRDHSINWATITAGGNCFLFTFQLRSEPTFFFFFWDFSIVCVWLLKLKLAQRLGQKWARKIVRLCGREEERERERESTRKYRMRERESGTWVGESCSLSVTRFGKISPLWKNNRSNWQFLRFYLFLVKIIAYFGKIYMPLDKIGLL